MKECISGGLEGAEGTGQRLRLIGMERWERMKRWRSRAAGDIVFRVNVLDGRRHLVSAAPSDEQ